MHHKDVRLHIKDLSFILLIQGDVSHSSIEDFSIWATCLLRSGDAEGEPPASSLPRDVCNEG